MDSLFPEPPSQLSPSTCPATQPYSAQNRFSRDGSHRRANSNKESGSQVAAIHEDLKRRYVIHDDSPTNS